MNLYPFDEVAGRKDTREEDAVEMIDIGGPAMLRAAAKNFVHVVPVCSPGAVRRVLAELAADAAISPQTRRDARRRGVRAHRGLRGVDRDVVRRARDLPAALLVSLEKERDLAYGENPHQRAAYYAEAGARRHLLSRVEQLAGRELSFNNLNDLDAARALAARVRRCRRA